MTFKCDIFVIYNGNVACFLWTAKKVQLEYNKDQVDLCPDGVDNFCNLSFGPYLNIDEASKPLIENETIINACFFTENFIISTHVKQIYGIHSQNIALI